ncbi:hypothetical protein ACLKMH_18020 [Psychromonas sp. KJ10-10]|uniref:hypothetical protein n=1 Tax=Psychromonas sp. KJ10-10 TaxID=3391823 RepID=UPI0039B3B1B6
MSQVIEASAEDDDVKRQIESMLSRSASEQLYQSLLTQLMATADIKYPVAN